MSAGGLPPPQDDDSDDRSAFAKALDVAYQLMAVCAMGAIPSVAGYFFDRWLGSIPLFTILGFGFGLTTAIYQFLKLLRRFESNATSDHDDHDRQKKVT